MNNNKNSLKNAFNLKANFMGIFRRENARMMFIDGLRCFAILQVVLLHSVWVFVAHDKQGFQSFIQDVPWYLRWLLAGDKGVDQFFVISGFLIGQMLFREYNTHNTIDLRRFFVRRFMRLTPAYYVVIVVFALTAAPHVERIWLWAFALYVNNYIPIEHNYIHFAWSLAIEEQFYAIFSLFVAFVFFRIRHQQAFLWLLFALSFAVIFWLLLHHPEILLPVDMLVSHVTPKANDFWQIIYDNLHTRYGAIVLGVILAHVYVYHWERVSLLMTPGRCVALFLAAITLLAVSVVLPVYSGEATSKTLLYFYHVTHRNFFALGVMCFMLLCLLDVGPGAMLNRFFSSRMFYPLSQLSYSLYLLHLPAIAVTYVGLRSAGIIDGISFANAFMVFACAMIPALLASSMMYVFVEQPFMKLRG